MRFSRGFLAFALAGALVTGGCAEVREIGSDIAVSTTTATPSQAKTVADAIQLTTLAEKSLDVIVTSGVLSRPVLDELAILVPAVHNALKKVEAANSAGNSALTAAALAAFNEALKAFNIYKQANGVK